MTGGSHSSSISFLFLYSLTTVLHHFPITRRKPSPLTRSCSFARSGMTMVSFSFLPPVDSHQSLIDVDRCAGSSFVERTRFSDRELRPNLSHTLMSGSAIIPFGKVHAKSKGKMISEPLTSASCSKLCNWYRMFSLGFTFFSY